MTLAVKIHLDLFHGESDWFESAAAVAGELRESVRRNVRYLRSHPDCPSPFARDACKWGSLRYLQEHANEPEETFRSIAEIIEAGGSDCDGLVPYVVAWRIAREKDSGADIFLQWKRGLQPGTLQYHVLEKNSRGEIGDPCRYFGMGRQMAA
jgi:hypothetical protein